MGVCVAIGRRQYLSVDTASHRLFLIRGDHVDVVDTMAKRIVVSIADTPGVHGVAIAGGLDRGYTSNVGANPVTVFALSSSATLASIPVGAKTDSIVYDPKSRRVFVANGLGKDPKDIKLVIYVTHGCLAELP